ncbi:MAG: S8 family serine peptidase [Bdellovibrionales bacterium]|nr:S8 family serine peptidase [Bdellovibrionales bacterium]
MSLTKWMILLSGLTLPFLYLNCQGGFKGTDHGLSSSSQCIAQPTTATVNSIKETNYFAKSLYGKSKLLLSQDPFQTLTQQKLNVKLGVPFAVMMDPKCVNAYVNPNDNSPLPPSQYITNGKRLELSVKIQTFPWTLNTQEELTKFEEEINNDVCVVAAGLNWDYDLQALDTSTINDPDISQQGHLNSLQFYNSYPVFYNSEKGIQKLKDSQRPIVVAVIDTGVAYIHSELKNNMWSLNNQTPYAGINAISLGIPEAEADFDPFDTAPNSHGTHVAGIIAAEMNNGVGGAGVAPVGVEIMAVRVFDTIAGSNKNIKSTTVDVVAGIMWAVDHGADILNLSLARNVDGNQNESTRDEILELAIKYALDKNVFLVFAAGNGNSLYPAQEITDNGFSILPARYGHEFKGAITVGSINVDDFKRSSFSHFSSKFVEIAAPGQESEGQGNNSRGILSTTSPTSDENKNLTDNYHRLVGTSMAAPMVAAAAALVKGLIRQNRGIDPTVDEIERLIKESAMNYGHLSQEFEKGQALDLSRLAVKVVTDYQLDIPLGELESMLCK